MPKRKAVEIVPELPERIESAQQELDLWLATKWYYNSFETPWYKRIFKRKKPTNPLAAWRPLSEILEEAKVFRTLDD
jgi:hypothetical protein